MFENLGPLLNFMTGLIALSAFIGAVSFVYYLWKRGKFNLDQETISTYEKNQKALEKRLEILTLDMTDLRSDLKEKDTKIEDLSKRISELTGENRILRQVLEGRDPDFKKNFITILTCVQTMQKDFKDHYDSDTKLFNALNRKLDLITK